MKRTFLNQKYLTELEENLSKTKKYYDYDDIEYR